MRYPTSAENFAKDTFFATAHAPRSHEVNRSAKGSHRIGYENIWNAANLKLADCTIQPHRFFSGPAQAIYNKGSIKLVILFLIGGEESGMWLTHASSGTPIVARFQTKLPKFHALE